MKWYTIVGNCYKVFFVCIIVLCLCLSCSLGTSPPKKQYLLVSRGYPAPDTTSPSLAHTLSVGDPLVLLDVENRTLQELPDFPVFALEAKVIGSFGLLDRLDLTWSPDGRYVLYVASVASPESQQNREIFRANADGTNLINLTNNPAADEKPTWSPDGQYIAFTSGREACNRDSSFEERHGNPDDSMIGCAGLYIMKPDGSEVRSVMDIRGVTSISWSPDSQYLAIQVGRAFGSLTPSPEVYVIGLDGNTARKLLDVSSTANPLDMYCDPQPNWSPDGQYIYLALMHNYLIHPDGSGLRRLQTPFDVDNACTNVWVWSPDGKSMATYFYSIGLVTIDVESGALNQLELTELFIENGQRLTYTPDGQRLIFQGYSGEGKYDIYSVSIESRELVNLTAQYPDSFTLIPEWVTTTP